MHPRRCAPPWLATSRDTTWAQSPASTKAPQRDAALGASSRLFRERIARNGIWPFWYRLSTVTQGAGAVWRELLTHLTVLGAQHGVLRIYVRSSEDAEAEDIFRQAGYKVVAREEVYVLTKRPAPAPLPRGLRRASSRDVPGLEDLSCHALPQAVQQVRGLMAPWQGGWRRAPWSSVLATDYVWAEKDKILAHLALRSTARGHWLEVAMRPERRADTLPHIKHMLTLAQSSASTPIYCPVPDYGVGLGWLLRTLGFESYARQVLLVVHTAPRIRVRQKIRLMGLERSVDAGTPIGRASRTGWPAD